MDGTDAPAAELSADGPSYDELLTEVAWLRAENAGVRSENAGLRSDLATRDSALSEASEQQTATAEVLRVIASSQTNLQHVLDVIATSTVRLCGAESVVIRVIDGDSLRRVALAGPAQGPGLRMDELVPISLGTVVGRAIIRRATIHIPDVRADLDVPLDAYSTAMEGARLATPLLHEGVPFGAILLLKHAAGPFTDRQVALLETFADQAAIAIENARLFEQLQQRNTQLTEALEQQSVTSEVLRIIASVPTDLPRVLQALVESVKRLTDADRASALRVVGDEMVILAATNPEIVGDRFPAAGSVTGEVLRDGRTVHLHGSPEEQLRRYPTSHGARRGLRTQLITPLLRDGQPLGSLNLLRIEDRPFTEQQIVLLEIFADQAVIAIENARLFSELEERNRELGETLEQQTATAEVLRVIASSPTALDRVFRSLAESALRLVQGYGVVITRADGDQLRVVATSGVASREVALGNTIPIDRRSRAGRAMIEGRVIQVEDAPAERNRIDYPLSSVRTNRATICVPMLRDGVAVGIVAVGRAEPKLFSEQQIALLETFADQAVIAIENARLFEELGLRNAELQESNRQVTEALEQQTATAEVLRVIASSPTDLTSVLQNVVESAARLCVADNVGIWRADGSSMERMVNSFADRGPPPGMRTPLDRGTPSGQVILDGQTLHVLDLAAEMTSEPGARFPTGRLTLERMTDASGSSTLFVPRTYLAVPLKRQGETIGAMAVERGEVRAFTGAEIALLETFADQAVIAIENARLFEELQERTAQLVRSVDELRTLGEVSQTVSSTLDLQEVLTTIVAHATRLADADAGTIYELEADTGDFIPCVSFNLPADLLAVIQTWMPSFPSNSVPGRAARLGQAQQATDLETLAELDDSPVFEALRRAGFRALIAVPLVREQRVVGMLLMRRKTPGEFPQPVVDLLQTFASQSVLAIENARLFQRVQETSRELAEASQHKSQFLANMSHELRTPLNAIIGYSEMLQEEAEDSNADAFLPDLQRFNAAGKHLLGLINDILDLSKIEAGRTDLDLSTFEIAQLVRDVGAIVQPLMEKNANSLAVRCPEHIGTMQADQTKVRQTLFNLLSNAAKFTDRGAITLTVERDADDWITFAVADSGIGMSQEQLSRLFEAFSQAETSTTRRYGGTGLGLAISRHFCRQMGGDISVTSAPGAGSTFTIQLPLRAADAYPTEERRQTV